MVYDNLLEKWDLENGAPSTVMKRAPGRGTRIAKYLAKVQQGKIVADETPNWKKGGNIVAMFKIS